MEPPDWLIERVARAIYFGRNRGSYDEARKDAEAAVAEVFSHLEQVAVDRDGSWWGVDGLPINNHYAPLYRFTEEET